MRQLVSKADLITFLALPFQFHLEQARVRANIRLQEGRAKPVDLLAKNLHLGSDFNMQLPYPDRLFDNLSLDDLKELKDDIRNYQVRG